jgi:phosphate uptake regulator
MTDLLKILHEKVIEMRKAQREYFRTRDMVALSQARNLEREVDKILKEIEQQKSSLASLF